MPRPFRLLSPSFAAAVGAGILVALSLPPFGFWILAPVGVAAQLVQVIHDS